MVSNIVAHNSAVPPGIWTPLPITLSKDDLLRCRSRTPLRSQKPDATECEHSPLVARGHSSSLRRARQFNRQAARQRDQKRLQDLHAEVFDLKTIINTEHSNYDEATPSESNTYSREDMVQYFQSQVRDIKAAISDKFTSEILELKNEIKQLKTENDALTNARALLRELNATMNDRYKASMHEKNELLSKIDAITSQNEGHTLVQDPNVPQPNQVTDEFRPLKKVLHSKDQSQQVDMDDINMLKMRLRNHQQATDKWCQDWERMDSEIRRLKQITMKPD